MVSWIIRLENLIIFMVALFAYSLFGMSWWYFLGWILPDLGMVGYLKNKRFGAICYNLVHNYLFCVGLILLGVFFDLDILTAFGIIFCSHVSLDRVLGFGLKYSSNFSDTHIQKLTD